MVRILTPTRLAAGMVAALTLTAALPAAAGGDPAAGKMVFASQCAVCHSAAKGGAPILGPTLFGVVGRKTASMPGFVYSTAMKSAGGVWTNERLETYLPAPSKAVPGTKMTYMGVKDPAKLRNLIAYLDTLK